MKLSCYAATDSLYVKLNPRPSAESCAISEAVVLDYDASDDLVGTDIDNASLKIDLCEITLSRIPAPEKLTA